MSDGDGRDYTKARRLALVIALIVITFAAMTFTVVRGLWLQGIDQTTYPIPARECAESQSCDEKALKVQARQTAIDETAAQFSLIQLALSVGGIVGLGVTFFYAHQAWREAQRAADIAQAETRPWVAIKVIPNMIRWNMAKTGILFQCDLEFQNVGKTIAEDFVFRVDWIFEGEGAQAAIAEHRRMAIETRVEGVQALLPGETWMWPGWSGLSLKHIHWQGGPGAKTFMMPVLLVTAFYRTLGEAEWLKTERFYSMVRVADEGRRDGITQGDLDLKGSDLLPWPRSGSKTK